jgi:hypothetical protein
MNFKNSSTSLAKPSFYPHTYSWTQLLFYQQWQYYDQIYKYTQLVVMHNFYNVPSEPSTRNIILNLLM